ncbi:hypothetical protein P22_0059 [Propionispora sp. 2/2-37]|uniref:ChbG/HpnK family deacetylase n=1 Tax=Propionispora sp. 2/2-37 TaxID=1677858 RepID=UPI0006BB700B|nr:ChbG/HpnK family deacetylase [Propionispora sp. 2/2-37]CUH93997.1 hypothetical protein P22_0059 [Propionispora sp. 2/2-37]
MKKIIVNADDFGLHEAINSAIIEGHLSGCVSSASIMPNGKAFLHAAHLCSQNRLLGVGVHLTLVGLEPLSEPEKVSSLVDDQGLFYKSYIHFLLRYVQGKIRQEEIKREMALQIEQVIAAGIPVTHLDSHQHLHIIPGIFEVVVELAKCYHIGAVRIPDESYFFTGGYPFSLSRILGRTGLTYLSRMARRKIVKHGLVAPDHFFGMLSGGHMSENYLLQVVEQLPEGVSEIMMHPGKTNELLEYEYGWGYGWEDEFTAVVSKKVRSVLKKRDIGLTSFGELRHA